MIITPRTTSSHLEPGDPIVPPPATEPKTHGLRWILSINTALWGLIIAGFWIVR